MPNELIGFNNVYKMLGDALGRFDTEKALDIQELSEEKRAVFMSCAPGWIRTSEGRSRQIYSLL